MAKSLVIVESPTKAKTLRGFLGSGYVVESSVGHVRDLPASAAEIPPELKKSPWARIGVNVEADFEPLYIVQPEKRKTIAQLRKLVGTVDEVLLATDEDREGEAISWHLMEVLRPKVPVRRMVFHEITRSAMRYELLRVWREESDCTELFVTHSIAEAVLLSDRVLVMTPQPGRIERVIDIDLPRPRDEEIELTPAFLEYARLLRDLLRARVPA